MDFGDKKATNPARYGIRRPEFLSLFLIIERNGEPVSRPAVPVPWSDIYAMIPYSRRAALIALIFAASSAIASAVGA